MFSLQLGGLQEGRLSRLMNGGVSALAPITLRITNSREVREEDKTVRSRALQLQAGEIKVSSYAIAGM